MNKSIVLGLSGGVDSAVAAGQLLADGWAVHGVWLDIGLGGGEDAAAVAKKLNIPFETVDIRDTLEQHVCQPFMADYLAGRTPIPCARCNPTVKFPSLLAVADRLGAYHVATGHYARIGRSEEGTPLLLRGHSANDQAYMLARLPREILDRVVFPLGNYEKNQVRGLAGEAALPVANKPDSMEICFIPDGDYATWLDRRGDTPPEGYFVDNEGQVLGRHKGIHHYTLGQRRGLGIALGRPMFVSAIRPLENQVVLSTGEDLYVTEVLCHDINWIAPQPLTESMAVTIRLRHSKQETEAVLSPQGDQIKLVTLAPARAPTPGQLAVFYQGDIVLGSGWISSPEM